MNSITIEYKLISKKRKKVNCEKTYKSFFLLIFYIHDPDRHRRTKCKYVFFYANIFFEIQWKEKIKSSDKHVTLKQEIQFN